MEWLCGREDTLYACQEVEIAFLKDIRLWNKEVFGGVEAKIKTMIEVSWNLRG